MLISVCISCQVIWQDYCHKSHQHLQIRFHLLPAVLQWQENTLQLKSRILHCNQVFQQILKSQLTNIWLKWRQHYAENIMKQQKTRR